MPKKKLLKPTKWADYPAESLQSRGDKVVQSTLKENIAVIAIVAAFLAGAGALAWYLA